MILRSLGVWLLAAGLTPNLLGGGIEFIWTPTPQLSTFAAYITYSGGTVANGVFTPTGLLDYTFGTVYGPVTYQNHDQYFQFLTDTPYGPSFNIQGSITPIAQEEMGDGPSLLMVFNGQQEMVWSSVDVLVPGTWSEVIIPEPSSALIFALGAPVIIALLKRVRRNSRVRVPS